MSNQQAICLQVDGFFFGYICKMPPYYSFIIPVYNRPIEVKELLQSFIALSFHREYEIVIVEDGSSESSENVVSEFQEILDISYYQKQNTGPGDSRNYGMKRAKGDYFLILDSDVLLPSDYLLVIDSFLVNRFCHCIGGADAAHRSFTPLQKAINYVMTSYLTTGGIRGKKNAVQNFEPRSYNMGISQEAFIKTGGFAKIHPGEDPDLSLRIREMGYSTAFVPGAYVFHKRRISLNKFYNQVQKFGLVRPILNEWHPHAAKITFWLPSVFVLFVMISIFGALFYRWWMILPVSCYLFAIFLHSSILNRSVYIGLLVVLAVFVQFFGYGIAFLRSTWIIAVLKKDASKEFPHLFFK